MAINIMPMMPVFLAFTIGDGSQLDMGQIVRERDCIQFPSMGGGGGVLWYLGFGM